MDKKEAVPQTLRQALNYGRRLLNSPAFVPLYAGPEASLEASLLLAHVLEQTRENLYIELDTPLAPTDFQDYQLKLQRRQNGEPLAWITGFREFRGRDFAVGRGVLCPRPESEHLVEAVLEHGRKLEKSGGSVQCIRVHDCCTGSGNLALSLALERSAWEISASDISPVAQGFFEQNNRRLTAGKVPFHRCDLLNGLTGLFDIIVSNPPYLTPQECNERLESGWLEPMEALNGGEEDGLGIIRRLIAGVDKHLAPGGMLALEASPGQMSQIRQLLFRNNLERIEIRRDLAGMERIALGFYKAKD